MSYRLPEDTSRRTSLIESFFLAKVPDQPGLCQKSSAVSMTLLSQHHDPRITDRLSDWFEIGEISRLRVDCGDGYCMTFHLPAQRWFTLLGRNNPNEKQQKKKEE